MLTFSSTLRKAMMGALIHGPSRIGKTRAIEYVRLLLARNYPKMTSYHAQCEHKLRHAERPFFANLLEAMGDANPNAGSNPSKRMRLLLRIREAGARAGSGTVLLFCDEAQRYNENEYEWLRDVHDALQDAYCKKHVHAQSARALLLGCKKRCESRHVLTGHEFDNLILRDALATKRIFGQHCVECFTRETLREDYTSDARHLRPRCDEMARCVVAIEKDAMRLRVLFDDRDRLKIVQHGDKHGFPSSGSAECLQAWRCVIESKHVLPNLVPWVQRCV
ncbi:hypothetical protein DFQ30_011221 [Apophysomyces sp. BC1015]|nr:hypothetical protein DFQ30_011221 [Apophysomyces sp. BC1015]